MSLPTPAQLQELSKLVVEHGKLINGKWYSYKTMKQTLDRMAGDIAFSAAGSAAKAALTALSGVSTGVAFVSFGAVLTPWIASADIARQAGTIFELHDLKEYAAAKNANSQLHYYCKCGKCFENIKYIVDKKERNVGRIAIGVATLGVSAIATSLYSVAKSFQSGRPKEMVSKGIVESARAGCTVAIATIFLLSGNWSFLRGGNAGIMRRAAAILTSEDGWKEFKSSW
ncbi:MAG: hypothetical protein IRZ04_13665 [Rhodospirillales bacterium]|nr:hypothetical protein [Rhodospirillales bacterium]